MTEAIEHVPVLVNEVIRLLEPCLVAGTVVDATTGGGGHLWALAREVQRFVPVANQCGRLIGIDIDEEAIALARKRLAEFGCTVIRRPANGRAVKIGDLPMVTLIKANYVQMREVVEMLGISRVSGVLMDLGLSSYQLKPRRGFSFEADGPLDMRYDQRSSGPTAREIIQRASIRELYSWLRSYADEPMAGTISRQIYAARKKLRSTSDLRAVVERVIPRHRLRKTLARVFQALRIVVNNELDNLQHGLEEAIRLLVPGGRLVVICYQSGEDRCFKQVYRKFQRQLLLLTRKPCYPDSQEISINPRARSARLRAVEKIRPLEEYVSDEEGK